MTIEFDTHGIAMNTLIPAAEDTIRIRGFYAADDGGGASFKRIAPPPDPDKPRPWQFKSNVENNWWELAESAVNPLMIGCRGNGVNYETAAMVALLNAFKDVSLPAGRVFLMSNDSEITTPGLTLNGPGAIKLKTTINPIPAPTGAKIKILAADVTIDGVKFIADNCSQVLNAQPRPNGQPGGDRLIVRNCSFSGNCNNYIATSSNGTIVQHNTFDCTSAEYVTTPVVLSGSDGRNHLCADNTFKEVFGFGVQAVGSSDDRNDQIPDHTGLWGVVIRNNSFTNSIIELAPQTLKADQSSFTVQLLRRIYRWTIYINGQPSKQEFTLRDAKNVLPGKGPFIFDKISGSVPADATVQFKFWRALESVNINRDCHGVLIDGNVITGSGDSGIVLCNDKIIIDPDDDEQNYFGRPPDDIVVSNNIISDTAYAGCAETHSIDGVSYIGNRIRDYSLAVKDPTYSSGILTTGGKSRIFDNIITGNGETTRLGICLNVASVEATPYTGNFENCADQAGGLISDIMSDNIVGDNVLEGSFVRGKYGIPQGHFDQRRRGDAFFHIPYQDYPGKLDTTAPLTSSGLPPDTPFLSFSKSPENAAGWAAVTNANEVPWVGAKAFKISGANRVNMIVPQNYRNVFAGTLMRIEFWAKTLTEDGASYVGIITSLVNQPRIVNLKITENTWKPYTILFPISPDFVDPDASPTANPLIIRHGTDANNEGLICGLRISYQKLAV